MDATILVAKEDGLPRYIYQNLLPDVGQALSIILPIKSQATSILVKKFPKPLRVAVKLLTPLGLKSE